MGQKKSPFLKATAKLGQIFEMAKFILLKSLKHKVFFSISCCFWTIRVISQLDIYHVIEFFVK